MDHDPRLPAALLRGSLSRRTLFQGAGAVALGSLLSACGTSGTAAGKSAASARAATDLSDTDKVINWSNWPLYIDVNDKTKAPRTTTTTTSSSRRSSRSWPPDRTPAVTSGAAPTGWSRD